ncbi:hypothetical protein [Sciscionella sediminilitoris]|uniref:hypothetical protein n=1 Tax=Sciscionella sediminilitoris TaxID=1445613 RepID=UPI0004DF27FF|nr:hypothetical protein [Sciscionella sp. SE31]
MTSLREELQGIYDRHQRLTPELVLSEARDPGHPLHNRFEWDDAAAAEKYRREQAHELIRTARIVYRDAGSAPNQVRAFQAVRDQQGWAYQPSGEIAENQFTRELVLRDMEREWRQLKRRYEAFEEFTQLVLREMSAA